MGREGERERAEVVDGEEEENAKQMESNWIVLLSHSYELIFDNDNNKKKNRP